MKNVFVLCIGNAGRSQMAEGYLNFYAGDKANIYSAGILEYSLHPKAVEVMAEDNIDISHYISQLYSSVKTIKYDYLITICDISTINIPTNLKWEKVYDLKITESAIVDDDHTTILNKFRGTREQIKKSILHFIGKELNTQTHEEFFVA